MKLAYRECIAVFALFVVCAAAQMQSGSAQVTQAQVQLPKATVSGRVANALTGEMVRKVSIILAFAGGRGQQQARTAVTDEQGVFSFAGVEPGVYRLIAMRVGFVRQTYGGSDPRYSGSGSVLNVRPGEEVKDILFRLQPAAAVSGRVVDQDGDPLMDVLVRAWRWQFLRGQRQLVQQHSDTSNDRGEYRIYDLAPGRYYLSATYGGGFLTGYLAGLGIEIADQAYVPVFYPGTNDPAQASALEVRGGDEVPGINFVIIPQRAVSISGRVANAVTGQVGRGVHVNLMPRLRNSQVVYNDQDTTTDGQGAFRVRGIPAGSYILLAEWEGEGQGPGRRHYSAHQLLDLGSADVDGVNLVISPGTDIAGSVKIEGTLSPPAPARTERSETVVMGSGVLRSSGPAQMRVLLEGLDEPTFGTNAVVKSDNSFVLENVSEGMYRVTVAGLPGNAYLKSARLGNQDVLEDGLVVVRGRRNALELVVSSLTGRLEGNALGDGDKPFAGARLALVPEGARRNIASLYRTAVSDQSGHFVFASVPPGDYKLFAWDTVEPGAYQDPDFLRPFEDRGQAVRVAESGQSTAEIKVIITEERGVQ